MTVEPRDSGGTEGACQGLWSGVHRWARGAAARPMFPVVVTALRRHGDEIRTASVATDVTDMLTRVGAGGPCTGQGFTYRRLSKDMAAGLTAGRTPREQHS